MAIPSTGAISFTTIQTEFGGSNPIGLNEYYAGGAYVPAGTSGTCGAIPSSGAICVNKFHGTSAVVPGSASYTTPGTYTWFPPAGVTTISVVAVGGGGGARFASAGGGGGGGGLGYINNRSVTACVGYKVVVGGGGSGAYCGYGGTASSFRNASCQAFLIAYGGNGGRCGPTNNGGGGYGAVIGTACGGATGGKGGNNAPAFGGGGGAAGYSGTGGLGGTYPSPLSTDGAGGGGGGGGAGYPSVAGGGGGGGVGLLGQGANGGLGTNVSGVGGGGGSGGGNGASGYMRTVVCYCCGPFSAPAGGQGGIYGGGGGVGYCGLSDNGGKGGVRIVWPGNTRQFPSTNVGSP